MKFSRGDKVFINDPSKLSSAARKILGNGANTITGTFRGYITADNILHAIVSNDESRSTAFIDAALISSAK